MSVQQRGIREIGREIAFFSLYIYDTGLISLADIMNFEWYEKMAAFFDEEGELVKIPPALKKPVFDFAGRLANGTVCNLVRIDKIIENHLVKWSFSRMHAVDKAILQISVYSILYQYDIPIEVVISEANELADKYSDEKAAHYINGILNTVKNETRQNPLISNAEIKKDETEPVKKTAKKKVVMKKKKGNG